jgi:hypothetical protein
MSFLYIKKDIRGNYLELEEMLDQELYNNLGETYSDYLNNYWVLLSDEQTEFKRNHPGASLREVWNMKLNPPYERTVEDGRRELLRKIEQYNVSENVDSFIVNDQITTWFTVQERLNYKQSIEAAKLLNIQALSFYIGDIKMDIAPDIAEQMLAMIQLYADQCFMVTKMHTLNVEKLSTIEEIDSYDYKSGYPERLNFILSPGDDENGDMSEE